MLPFLLLLYNLAFPVLFLLYAPFYLVKLIRRGNFRNGFGERFGLFSAGQKERLRALREPIWIHAVSVGETIAALSFIRQWTSQQPDLQVVLSTTTSTGQAIAREKAPANVVPIYCPIDWYPTVALALRRIRPAMVVIFEVEIWPNLICLARSRGALVTLINGRLSDHSAAGYARWRFVFQPLLAKLAWIGVQMPDDERRMRRVVGDGAPIEVCNTMKFDQVPDRSVGAAGELLAKIFPAPNRMVLMAASTHPGEEALMARVYLALRRDCPSLRLTIVPRHVERTAEIESAIGGMELRSLRLSDFRAGNLPASEPDVLLVNTTGEMMDFLAAADLVFMGKSLAGNEGGHNIIEPAIFGKPILFGPAMGNFRVVAQVFKERRAAIEVADEAGLMAELARLIADPAARRQLAEASRRTVEEQRGATVKTIAALRRLLATR